MNTVDSVNGLNQAYESQQADIDTASDDYAGRFAGPVGEYFLKLQEEITISLIDAWRGARVLDVGGGHGQLAIPLVREGFAVTVAGSDPACRNRLDRALPADSFQFEVCDLLNLPFEDRSFDIVIAFRLLPHEEQWQRQIAEMCRVAKYAVVADYPDIRSFNFLYQSLFTMKKGFEKNTREFLLFRRSEIVRAFQQNGFADTTLKPQFFIPMVVHRFLRSVPLSRLLEGASAALGLRYLLGSPVIVRARRPESS